MMNRSFELNEKQRRLLEFVKEQHGSQVRKYDNAPYWHHLVSVARIVAPYADDDFSIETALCHDLYEDTPCREDGLANAMKEAGYSSDIIRKVAYEGVPDLTDVYIKTAYPDLNRRRRKALEAERMSGIAPSSQTIKYADLIDNTGNIVEFDRDFARVFLCEAESLLTVMTEGNAELREKCREAIQTARRKMGGNIPENTATDHPT